MTQRLKKFLIDTRHVTIQLRHGSVYLKKITSPEEASRMRCDTVAIKNRSLDDLCIGQINYIMNLLVTDEEEVLHLLRFYKLHVFLWAASYAGRTT